MNYYYIFSTYMYNT